MLVYISINGIILSALLMYFNARKFPSSIYLSLFIFAISLNGIIQYAMLYSNSISLIAIFTTHFAFILLLTGPAFYLYIRSVLSDNYRLYRKDLWHLVPMTIYLISVIPYYLRPFSEKTALAQEIVNDRSILSEYKFGWLAEILSNGIIYVSRPLLAMFYIGWSIGMLILYLKRHEDKLVFRGQSFMLKWLYVFISSSLLLVVSNFVLMTYTWVSNTADLFYTINTLQVLSFVGLTILLISPFFFPEILYGLPRVPVMISGDGSAPETTSIMEEGISKYNLKFETDYLNKICNKIESIMQTDQPYSQIDLNMARFSGLVDVPFHHLAYYFREVKKQSFNDFRNEWRIKYAKNFILEGNAEELTLEAIGLKSGFTNRSTFFRAFKRVEGVAPAEYLAKTRQKSSSNHL